MSEIAYLGLGSNIGDRVAYLQAGTRALATKPEFSILKTSSVYETSPEGYLDQGDFLNAALSLRTTKTPASLLETMSAIEDSFGRQRTIHWGPRTLDLDLLMFGNCVVDEAHLKVPHPRLLERRFALEPLAEIAPELVHPQTGRSMAEHCTQLVRPASTRKLGPLAWV